MNIANWVTDSEIKSLIKGKCNTGDLNNYRDETHPPEWHINGCNHTQNEYYSKIKKKATDKNY